MQTFTKQAHSGNNAEVKLSECPGRAPLLPLLQGSPVVLQSESHAGYIMPLETAGHLFMRCLWIHGKPMQAR